jgi:hypothetical protein
VWSVSVVVVVVVAAVVGSKLQRIQAMQATITTVRCGKDKESNSAKVDKKPYKSDSLVS